MEIKTCEQYVLSELDKAQLEIELLNKENAELLKRIKELEAQLEEAQNSEASELDAMVVKAGRSKLFNEGCNTYEDVMDGDELRCFVDWRSEATSKYSIPKGWKRQKLMEYFEPEYLALYRKKVDELNEEAGGEE